MNEGTICTVQLCHEDKNELNCQTKYKSRKRTYGNWSIFLEIAMSSYSFLQGWQVITLFFCIGRRRAVSETDSCTSTNSDDARTE